MGLDAHVRCRCWQDAKITPPPVSVEFIVLDGDGRLDLTLPYRGNEELFRRFGMWEHAEACPHEDMDQACERIGGNWSGYESFREALGELGWEKFPTLKRYLPDHNGGCLPAHAASAALAELTQFNESVPRLHQTVLVDHDTGTVIWRYINDYARAGMLCGTRRRRLWAGLDRRGFFVRETTEPPTELFRAVRFDVEATANATKLTDGARTIELPRNPFESAAGQPPSRLRVEVRARDPDEHTGATDGLATVLRASIDTGNPVMWT